MKKILVALALLWPVTAHAQPVQQSGPSTNNTSPIWGGTGILKGGNTATDSPLTTFGVTRDAADAICVSSDRVTAAGRNQLCLQAATSGPAKISIQNYGTASPQNLQFVLNGTPLTLPSGGGTFVTGSPPYSVGHAACFLNTSGVIQDCGGTPWGIAYFSATSALVSTTALSNGQMLVGQTGGTPTPRSLSGDVSTVSAVGAVTLQSVNGIPFGTSYTAHGVLLGQGANQFVSSTSANTGYCLLSQGLSVDPVWAACSSGSGSAGGSDTQVQFNNATSLAGSANLTWVSPALMIGVSGSATGQLVLRSAANGAVSVQVPTGTTAYNFNLPPLAGSAGQPMLSGGGGAAGMSFGTLGLGGGGTGQTAAGGATLDAISGFSSTGYINRTGAGTYAFSTVIPVSGGGTGLASGTSGGILGYTASGTLASSVALTTNALVLGGGVGATPVPMASLGTTTTVLHGNAVGAPTFAGVSLTTDVTGNLSLANGGTNANLTAANGGIVYSSASALAILTPSVTASLPLLSGASTSPTWATVSYPTSATSGGVAYFSSSTVMASSGTLAANGVVIGGGAGSPPITTIAATNGQVLIGQTGAAPTWNTVTGNVAISTGGVTTIGASQVSNSMLANAAAYTFKGNPTGSSAAPTDFTMASLTQKASPAAGDYVIIADNAAAGATKYATVSSIASAGSVSSIAGNTGAFTLANGIDNSGNQLQLTAARRTLPTIQKFISGTSLTYTTPANVLWIEIEACGGAGGGAGSGTTPGGTGGTGGATSFGALALNPGVGGTSGGSGGIGGTVSLGLGVGTAIPGAGGGGGGVENSTTFQTNISGGTGGSSPFGGAGGGIIGASGMSAATNSCSGGGGSATANTSGTTYQGGGGGAGGYAKVIVTSPASTYTYSVGAGGSAGAATSGGFAGGTGGAGYIIVTEHYGT